MSPNEDFYNCTINWPYGHVCIEVAIKMVV